MCVSYVIDVFYCMYKMSITIVANYVVLLNELLANSPSDFPSWMRTPAFASVRVRSVRVWPLVPWSAARHGSKLFRSLLQ